MNRRILAACAVFLLPLTLRAADPALGGNCAVCLLKAGKVVAGSPDHAVVYDRQTYLFPSAAEKTMFVANPAKFAPALGGDCVVCRREMGVRMPGEAEFALTHAGRVFLFPSAKERDLFKADPKKYEDVDLGLKGYCPVCAVNAKKWVTGKAEFTTVYDGIRYRFPSTDEQTVFAANPAAFTPVLEGDCVVCLKDAGKRVAGAIDFAVKHDGRMFLFPDEAIQSKFSADPLKYANVDLAANGNCVVCAKMGKGVVAGRPEIASIYQGLRYLFPNAEVRAAFDAEPAKFAAKNGAKMGAAPAMKKPEALAANAIAVAGKTACAGCTYGVHPVSDSESLGIAVVSGNMIYVVEGGEAKYPELYKARFGGVSVELKGIVKKTQGKFVWVEPTSLARSR